MTDLPDLKIKALVNFPADVIGDAGIDVNKIGGRYHLALGYGDFTPPIIGVTDPANQNVLIWNAITEEYKLASIAVLTGVSYEHLELTGIEPTLVMNAFTTGNYGGAWFGINMARGTSGSPLAVQNNDFPFGLYVDGYDGAAMSNSASAEVLVDGPVSVGNVPLAWRFRTGHLNDGGTERLRITSAGKINIGTSGPFNTLFDFIPDLSVNSTGGELALNRYINSSSSAAALYLTHSRNATVGLHTILQDGDNIGSILFAGSDGANFAWGASISASVDGVPGPGDMPTRLMFWTSPDGTELPVERLRINSAGHTIFVPGSAAVPTLANGQFTLTPTSNTNMRISYRGTDGVLRVTNFTML